MTRKCLKTKMMFEQYSRYQSDYIDHLQEQEAAERAKDRDYREWLAGSDGPDAPPADTKPKDEPLVGIPGKTYPYPLEEDVDPNARFEEFRDLRDMLLNHARTLAADLKPADPDINLRTLALARLLDRVQQLERMLPDLNPERVIRFEYVYDGAVHNVQPWEGVIKDQNKFREEMNRMIIEEGVI